MEENKVSKSMEQISLLSRLSTKRQNKSCNSTYEIRKLKNKGAIIVLIWNFFVVSVCNYLITALIVPLGWEITTVAWGLILPFAGWLADIRYGRYKVMRWRMWIMCAL